MVAKTDDLQIFVCGSKPQHQCDDKGKWEWYMTEPDGSTRITYDEAEARKRRCSGGSVTCSVCGISSQERSLWLDD